MKNSVLAVCLGSILLIGVPRHSFADILPADRRIDWSQAGVVGGIPTRTTVCSTLSPGATVAQINTAIANCPSGQAVFLNAGTYNLSSQIRIQNSNVTLRGAGPGKTILTLTSPLSGSFGGGSFIWLGVDNWQAIFSDNLPVVTIQSGATKDSTSITVSNASGIAAGDLLVIDELNDSSVTYVLAPTYLSRQQGTRTRGQMVEVAGVSGNTVTLTDPLYMTYAMSLTPQAVVIKNNIVTRWSGIEDMTLTQPAANTNDYYGSMIAFDAAENCWVKDVEIANISSMGIQLMGSLHAEVRNNYTHDSSIDATGGWIPLPIKGRFGNSFGYAFIFNKYNSAGLVENNIIKDVGPGFEMIGVSSGNVVAYNYAYNILYNNGANNFLGADQGSHGDFPMLNLWESNIGFKINSDNTNGGAGYNTFFREYSKGYIDDSIYHSSVAAIFFAGNIYMNAIGNVLGTPGKSNIYQSTDGNDLYQNPPPNAVYLVWHLGYWDGSHAPDPQVGSTLFRWGNFDYVTNTAHWDPAEVPTAYGVTVPSDHLLPASLFLSARPGWFTTPWGTPAWPAVGPDVTGGNGDNAGHVYKTPAQLCYENTIAQGLSFAPSTCYGASIAPSLSAGTVSGQTNTDVDLPVTFTQGSTSVSALQFDLGLPAQVSFVAVSAGDAATAANKLVASNIINGSLRVLVYGLNQTAISTGVIAVVRLHIASSATAGNYSLSMTGVVLSSPDGYSVPSGTSTDGVVTVLSILYGDVSENGTVTAYDASLAAQYAVGSVTLTASQITKADVSGNGSVTAYDASLIAQYAVGLITKFPVQG